CIREKCTATGCSSVPEPDRSPCGDNPNSYDDLDCVWTFCSAGECVTGPETGEYPCDDGVPCTEASTCYYGVCIPHFFADPLCGNQEDADPDCIREKCTATGCSSVPEPDGSACGDDGIPCTDQRCQSGQCIAVPIHSRCDDHDADTDCLRADCDPVLGCFQAIEPDASPCEDGIDCTGSDYCLAGQCYAGISYDFLCPNQDVCDRDCIQYYCEPGQGCVEGVEVESAPCRSNFCDFNGLYSACNASGTCECRIQPPPDFGCPP
ncbi:MAG: hypothetical protein AABZ12_13810, partial [Planctomycetota bacterium]